MTNPVETTIEGTGGKLFVRIWRPETKPRAIVAICHGFNSHSGYYGWAAEQLVAANYAAYAVDLRGRGKSDGDRFYIKDISEYESDVDSLIKFAKSKEPGLPVFLLGHSAGGVTSCIYTLDHQSEILGLICQSFAYRTPGLYVLPVRVYRAAEVFELADTPYYAGCRSWVELERALPTTGAAPVLTDDYAPVDNLIAPIFAERVF